MTNNGTFLLEDYADHSGFHVSVNEDRTLASISVPAIETPTMAILPVSQVSSRSSRRVLATLRVICADTMLDTGNPSNIHCCNLTVHVNIYREEDGTIPYILILEKVMESMDEENLVLVKPNGQTLYDQEGTRG